ncbi:MAG: tripartite tricarboxylate transporter substrate-binding protein [Alphaproteobacteria bacterium]|nr:tripartite tricarboxylate transporter substrate-binding protein [Alphaproteobacteria bacterium]
MIRTVLGAACAASLIAAAGAFSPASADAISDFYGSKRMTILISTPPGGGYDVYARLLGRSLGEYIPGKPTIIPRNMPGAGGMVLLNYAYNKGAKDGTLLFTLHYNLPMYQAMGGRGVKYDARKIIGLGRLLASNAVTAVWAKSKSAVKTIGDALEREAVIGSTGATSNSTVYPIVLNNMLGTKFKVVSGYAGGGSVFLAMERGEIDGFGAYSYLTLKSVKPDYLTQKKIQPIVQWGPKREEEWSHVPTAVDLAKSGVDRAAMKIASTGPEIGFSYFMPPGVPAARVNALRTAFNTMIKDPAFLREAKRHRLDLRTADAAYVEKLVADVMAASPDSIDRLRQLMVVKGKGARCQDYTAVKYCRKKRKRKKKNN